MDISRDSQEQQALSDLRQQLAKATALLRRLYGLAYERESDHDYGHQTRSECRYCGAVSNMDERVEHEAGCFVGEAREWLEGSHE